MEPRGANQVRVVRAMNEPGSHVIQDLLGFRAGHSEFSGERSVEFGQDLDADRSGPLRKQPDQEFNSFFVLSAGGPIMSVDKDIRIDKLNAHAALPESSGSLHGFPDRERSESG